MRNVLPGRCSGAHPAVANLWYGNEGSVAHNAIDWVPEPDLRSCATRTSAKAERRGGSGEGWVVMVDTPPPRVTPIWVPDPEIARSSTLARFAEFVREQYAGAADDPLDYGALWTWSTENITEF